MEVLTGDETGLLKLVNVTDKSYLTYGGEQSRLRGIKSIVNLSNNDHRGFQNREFPIPISVLRGNGDLEMFSVVNGEINGPNSITNVGIDNPVGNFKSIDNPSVVNFNDTGKISISKFDPNSSTWSGDNFSFSLKGPISAGASCKDGGAAFGGRENDLQVYDLNTQQSTWQAKNVPHDNLNLRVPVWVTSIKFSNPFTDTSAGACVFIGTGHKQVRLYDTRIGKQPAVTMAVSDEFRVTAIEPSLDGNLLYWGDTAGGLYAHDLRKLQKAHTFKGFAGSVRDIRLSMDLAGDGDSYLCAVGLDRFLRVYNVDDCNRLENASYLKNRLNSCLPLGCAAGSSLRKAKKSSRKSIKDEEEEAGEGDDDDDDDVVEEFADSSDEDFEDKRQKKSASNSTVSSNNSNGSKQKEVIVEEESGDDDDSSEEEESQEEGDDDDEEEEEDDDDDNDDESEESEEEEVVEDSRNKLGTSNRKRGDVSSAVSSANTSSVHASNKKSKR